MVKKKPSMVKNDCKTLYNRFVKFREINLIYPPFTIKVPIAHWNFETVSEYYRLRKKLSVFRSISNNSKELRLPINAWILSRYVFESIFLLFNIGLFLLYITKVPVYKGMISFYVGFLIFSYFVLCNVVLRFNDKVVRKINIVVEQLGSI